MRTPGAWRAHGKARWQLKSLQDGKLAHILCTRTHDSRSTLSEMEYLLSKYDFSSLAHRPMRRFPIHRDMTPKIPGTSSTQ